MSFIYKLSNDVAPSLHEVLKSRKNSEEWNNEKHSDEDWTLQWSTKRYLSQEILGLESHQKLNHFRRTSAITKKDNLQRNIRRMRCNYKKMYDFHPETWLLPMQHSQFAALYHPSLSHLPKKIWIAKPSSGRRGQNISIFQELSELKYNRHSIIVQEYIRDPFLIGGYKFDLRIYVLVTSFRPLCVWLFSDGLCRFSTHTYDLSDLSNAFAHLTNVSINKNSKTFAEKKSVIGKGCKWTITHLMEYLIANPIISENETKQNKENDNQNNIKERIWSQIRDIIILTLISINLDVEQSEHCFEMFGFDILVDEKMKCWLLEVNGSPAIAINCEVDEAVKRSMLSDLIDCVFTDDHSCANVGGFQRIFPFNSKTYDANLSITHWLDTKSKLKKSQMFHKIVVREIRKRRKRSSCKIQKC